MMGAYFSSCIWVSIATCGALAAGGCQAILGISDVEPDNATDSPDSAAPPASGDAGAANDGQPVPAPAGFGYRQKLRIQARESAIPEGYSMRLIMDTQTLVSEQKLREDASDLRIYRAKGGLLTELPRWLDDSGEPPALSAETQIWFPVREEIGAGQADETYYVYYGNTELTEPAPDNMNQVFLFGDNFERVELSPWIPNGRGEQASTEGGLIPIAGARSLRLEPGGLVRGGIHVDMELANETLCFSHWVRQEQTNASLGNLQTYEVPWATRDAQGGWHTNYARAWNELDDDNTLTLLDGQVSIKWLQGLDAGEWHHLEFIHNTQSNTIRARMDDLAWTETFNDRNGSSQAIKSFSILGEAQGGLFFVDNYIIRLCVESEPMIESLSTEARGPTWGS